MVKENVTIHSVTSATTWINTGSREELKVLTKANHKSNAAAGEQV